MAGKKGFAGRKGFYDEQMVKKIVDKSNKIILETLEKRGHYADLSAETVVELASRFCLRGMPQKMEIEGGNLTFVKVYIPTDRESECLDLEAPQRTPDEIPSQSSI